MLLDEIQEAKEKYLSFVKPKYIELYGELEPDILFIGKSLLEHGFGEIKSGINAQVVFVDDYDHIAWHKKSQIDNLIRNGKDGSEDIGLAYYENDEDRGDPRKYIFSDVLCDFEIKAYIEQSI
ncbi:hypothetical protein [Acinetobacter sp. TSRC1-2]|uniref:hypothetical protein n=1 Tax=unclassified Acinetobacter TaxID=196816 RepID=UPI003CF04DEE